MQPSTVALSSSWCCWALRFRYWKACASFTFLASCCPSEAPASTPKWTRTAPKWAWGVLPAPSSLPLLPWGASQGFRKCPATENWFFINQNKKNGFHSGTSYDDGRIHPYLLISAYLFTSWCFSFISFGCLYTNTLLVWLYITAWHLLIPHCYYKK